jgi:hypothetical protein
MAANEKAPMTVALQNGGLLTHFTTTWPVIFGCTEQL